VRIAVAFALSVRASHATPRAPAPKGIRITRSGALWPDDGGLQQSIVLDLLCDPADDAGQPEFVSYDGKTATVQWKHMAACAFKGSEPPKDDDTVPGGGKSESVGSGLGWFFLVYVVTRILSGDWDAERGGAGLSWLFSRISGSARTTTTRHTARQASTSYRARSHLLYLSAC
jgi:hypothetical protein